MGRRPRGRRQGTRRPSSGAFSPPWPGPWEEQLQRGAEVGWAEVCWDLGGAGAGIWIWTWGIETGIGIGTENGIWTGERRGRRHKSLDIGIAAKAKVKEKEKEKEKVQRGEAAQTSSSDSEQITPSSLLNKAQLFSIIFSGRAKRFLDSSTCRRPRLVWRRRLRDGKI